jgi:hypothetical protein
MTGVAEEFLVYCRKHQRFELTSRFPVHLTLQLGTGFFNDSLNGWVELVTHQSSQNDSLPDRNEGSHGCGNGNKATTSHADSCHCSCLFCMLWEAHMDKRTRDRSLLLTLRNRISGANLPAERQL